MKITVMRCLSDQDWIAKPESISMSGSAQFEAETLLTKQSPRSIGCLHDPSGWRSGPELTHISISRQAYS